MTSGSKSVARKIWSDVNAIYQIYPRSFMDSNGDGVGDLRGVINRLDYIKGQKDSLGIDAIWFSPLFRSPMADMGYDVSDYCDIDPLFGTLDDFTELVAKAHSLHVRVMLDFVPNHTSNQHPWFIKSRSSAINDKSAYYVWRDAKPDGSPPNNWLSIFGGSAWEWDDGRRQYYLHTFLKEQPDLNWDNPMVRDEMKRIVRFWLDRGVDGIRADAVRWISKDPRFRDDPVDTSKLHHSADGVGGAYDTLIHRHSRFWKNLFSYLHELTNVLKEYDNRIMIFEDYPDGNYSTREQYLGFYGVNPEVSMPFNFEGIWTEFTANAFRTFITEFQGMLNPDQHVPVYCFGNHDQWRLVTRMGGEEQARLIALLQLTLPGLPVVYYGDELAMPNTPVAFKDIQDKRAVTSGMPEITRDYERTPMQWHAGSHAGFSDTTPWLPTGESVSRHNVETQLHEPDSMLSLYRRMLRLRSRHEILRSGTYEALNVAPDGVFLFSRWLREQHVYIVLNFIDKPMRVSLPHKGRTLCCTHPVDYPEMDEQGRVYLRPYEGVLVECEEHPLND